MQIRRVFRNKKTNKQTHQFPKTQTYSLLHSFESSLLAYFFLPSCQLYAAAYPFQLISYDRWKYNPAYFSCGDKGLN